MEEKYIEYAVIILVIVTFCISYKIFVTPKQMDDELENAKKDLKKDFQAKAKEMQDDFDKKLEAIKDDYVRKEVHDLAMTGMQDDLKEVKQDVKDMKNILMQQSKGVV